MSNAEQWISLKDQQPGDDQFPVWYANQPAGTVWHSQSVNGFHATHWKPAERTPAPPPRAKTLAELDEDSFRAFRAKVRNPALTDWESYRAALAYERATILAMLEASAKFQPPDVGTFYEQMRLRVKGGAS